MSDTAELQTPPPAAATEPRQKRAYHHRKAPKRTAAPRAAPAPRVVASPATATDPAFEEGPLTRVSRDQRMTNSFPVPAYGKKPGRDYQWIATHVLGEPVTTPPITEFYEGGWRPEMAANWPTLVAPGAPPDGPVDRMGQRLFGRPMSFTIEARDEDYRAAETQRRDRMIGAMQGNPSGGGGIAGVRGVRVEPLVVEVEGEFGSKAAVPRR